MNIRQPDEANAVDVSRHCLRQKITVFISFRCTHQGVTSKNKGLESIVGAGLVISGIDCDGARRGLDLRPIANGTGEDLRNLIYSDRLYGIARVHAS